MNLSSLTIAAMLAATPPNDKPSTFMLDPAHEPVWVNVDEKEGLKIWWDRNAKGEITFDQREYPVVLLRGFSYFNSEPLLQTDMVMAVDCQTQQVATMKSYFPHQKGMVEEGLKFRAWPDPDREEIHGLLVEVCGECWGL